MKTALQRYGVFMGGLVAAAFASATAFAAEPVIRWDTASAQALGTFCDSSNTYFISAGNKLSVIFSGMDVFLPAGPPAVKARIETCSLAIKAAFSSPHVALRTKERLSWSCFGFGSGSAELKLASGLCGIPNQATQARCGEPYLEQSGGFFTPPESQECLYVARIAVSAWTFDARGAVYASLDGEGLQLDVGD